MLNKSNIAPFLFIIFLGVLTITAQTTPEGEIKSLELEIKIKQHELEIKKLEAERNKLKKIPAQSTPTPTPRPDLIPTPPSATPASAINTQPSANLPLPQLSGDVDSKCFTVALDKEKASIFDRNLCNLVENILAQGTPQISIDNANTELLTVFAAEVLKRKKLFPIDSTKEAEAQAFLFNLEKKRIDKQVGSNPNSSGTTTLAVKGGTPSVIGWALENGAATSSISGTTVTLRINPVGLTRALGNQGFASRNFFAAAPQAEQNETENFIRKFSVGFSFDTSRGTEVPTFVVSKQQLSAVSARYEFVNQRTPQSKQAQTAFRKFVESNTGILNKLVNISIRLKEENTGKYKNKVLQAWVDQTNKEIENFLAAAGQRFNPSSIREIIERQLGKFPVDELLNDPAIKQELTAFLELTGNYVDKRKELLEEINKGTIISFEYTNNREANAPDTSNFRFIWERGIYKNIDFTFNGSATIFNKKPTGINVQRLRDFQFALQADVPLVNTFGLGDSVLSFAGRYQRSTSNLTDSSGLVIPNTKGDTAIGQIKLTIPIADFGIRLPLSVTFANRSELIKESTIRANFGFTFDLDPLFARFKPF